MPNKKLSASEESPIIAAANDIVLGGELTMLDPLLGDQACHIRAFALVNLIRKIPDLDNPLATLNEKEKNFLEQCRLMSLVRIEPEKDEFGFYKATEKTKETKTAKQLRKECTSAALEATTSLVNTEIATLLIQNIKKLKRNDPNEDIKVLPLYLSLLGILQSESAKQSPILLTISKINPAKDFSKIESVDKITVLLTSINSELKVASLTKAKTFFRQPAIHILLNAIDLDGLSKEDFIQKYFSANIMELLLASPTFHGQYPKLADGENPNVELGNYTEKFKSTRSFGESKRFVEDSRLYNFTTKQLRTELLQCGMPPQIEHIMASIISDRIIQSLTTISSEEVCKNIAI